jgi:peptidoglycan/LPS O-acetylase OafA/YrhL
LLQIGFKAALRFSALAGPAAIVAAWVVSFALIAAVGIGLHLYFERPVTRRLKAVASQSPTRAQQPAPGATS